MNIRSLTRGDGVVIGAAVVLFIASFLDLYSIDNSCVGSFCSKVNVPNAWDALGLLMSMFLAGIIGAALIVVARALPQPKKIAGLDLGQFGTAFTIFSAWTAFWTIVDMNSAGAGMILGLIAALVLAGGAVASPLVAPLKAPLMGAPSPAVAQPYGAQPYGAQQPAGGYGYPAGAQQQPFGAQPVAGQPSQGGQTPAPAPAAAQQQPAAAAAPAGDFAPFWFAVPVARPLYAEDGSPTPIAELAPGTWYLAVEQRGAALVAQTQDGRRGVLQDTTGIQRG
ncbi:DUF5336 domain-containing protein [Streptomyces sp. BR1]|uniref:DUF5336 domain-containing protein n=1 Tax=Streptomyces sp. BR1 TaxID=1592323 RepID=UPI00402B7EBD